VLDSKTGAGFVILAAIANANFALPMTWMPRWSWENSWSVWSVCSLLVFPFLAAFYRACPRGWLPRIQILVRTVPKLPLEPIS
jgi:hypothetical protein